MLNDPKTSKNFGCGAYTYVLKLLWQRTFRFQIISYTRAKAQSKNIQNKQNAQTLRVTPKKTTNVKKKNRTYLKKGDPIPNIQLRELSFANSETNLSKLFDSGFFSLIFCFFFCVCLYFL